MLGQFKRMNIGKQIVFITLGMVAVISLIFFILNYIILKTIDDKINKGIEALTNQEKNILKFYSKVSADILMEEVNKIRSYALLINKSIYWAHYFGIIEKTKGEVKCQNDQTTPIDEKMTSTFRHFVSTGFIASDYFTEEKKTILTQSEKDIINNHWGKTLNTIKGHLITLGRVKDDEILRVIVYLTSVPDQSTVKDQEKGILAVFPGSCAMIEDVKKTSRKQFKNYFSLSNQNEDGKKKIDQVYISKPEFSTLLNTWITSVCTHYHHKRFESIKDSVKHHVITCIDLDMSKYLKIKKNEENALKSDAQLPQLDRSTFLVTDGTNKVIRMDPEWLLPLSYSVPYQPHLIPITGIIDEPGFRSMVDKEEMKQLDIVSDPKNPSLTSKMTIIAQKRPVGLFQEDPKSSKLTLNSYQAFFYFDSKRKGDKTGLIQDRVQNSKWQITLLTLIFIMMVSGVVMCISYKFQKEITRPLTKIIQFTKILSTIEEGGENETTEKMTIDDIPEGIYQSKELVERFKTILFGKNKKNENEMVSYYSMNQGTSFPYNELHVTSPFSKLIDWEPKIAQLENKTIDKRSRMGMRR